jgi:predicted nucleic acid-binding protein
VTGFVLDCSISAAWCLKDESNVEADRCLRLLARGEAYVPAVWTVEMVNVLVMAERRRRITGEDATLALELLGSLPILVDTAAAEAMPGLRVTAVEHRLSAYDASYLEVALRRGLPFASLDRALRSAATASGIRLL